MTTNPEHSLKEEIPGHASMAEGQGELPMLAVSTRWSTAEIYLHGAHVTQFRKEGEAPLLFTSQCSRFDDDHPIRGGIPVIFPWFGFREGLPQHGFARLKNWDLKEVVSGADGSVSARFRLPDCPEASTLPPCVTNYTVTVKDSLDLQLSVTNNSREDWLTFEDCLHTYLEVGDVTAVSIHGLKGVSYLDKVANFARRIETEDPIRIGSEVDRVYLETTGAVEVRDARLGRRIIVEKEGSASTVLWNPWAAIAQQMTDFGNEEYSRMLCVESGNIAPNDIKLAPGQTATLKVRLHSEPLS
jgi:glucose-6-phosphate 1-epimerase